MVAFNKEQATCNGRGFAEESANGFLKNFKDWVVRPPVASPVAGSTGGPGWYIIDDQSILSGGSANKYSTLEGYYYGFGSLFDSIGDVQAITDGSFRITINGVTKDITGLNFSGVSTYADAAAVIEAGIQAASVSPNDGYDLAEVHHFKTQNTSAGVGVPHKLNYQNTADTMDRLTIIAGEPGMDLGFLESAGVGTGLSGSSYLGMDDSSATRLSLASEDAYIVISDNASPTLYNKSKIIQIGMETGVAGRAYVNVFHHWDTDLHRGFCNIANARFSTVDDGDFIYDFRGGPEIMAIQSRVGSTWYSFVLDEFDDLPDHVEDSTKRGSLDADVAVGATSFDVGVGEGSKFTVGESYFILDFDKNEAVEYVKVNDVTGDTITINTPLSRSFKAGSEMTAYHLRFYTCSSSSIDADMDDMHIPLRSDRNREWGVSTGNTTNYCKGQGDFLYESLLNTAPNDKGEYAVQKPIIKEHHIGGQYYYGNRIYGKAKNQYFTAKSSMLQMANGRTINGDIFVFYQETDDITDSGSSLIAAMIPDTDKAA